MKYSAIIVDLDGTLADVRPVRHYVTGKKRNFQKFHEYACTDATPNRVVLEVLQLCTFEHDILLVSGRHEKWRPLTEAWLGRYEISWDELWMRPDDDYRKDVELKRDIYNDHIAAEYDVRLALDDNPRIVDLWRSLGIPVLVVPGWDDDTLEVVPGEPAPQNEV